MNVSLSKKSFWALQSPCCKSHVRAHTHLNEGVKYEFEYHVYG